MEELINISDVEVIRSYQECFSDVIKDGLRQRIDKDKAVQCSSQ